jgi:GNAT superfamily N-acetyltransferase
MILSEKDNGFHVRLATPDEATPIAAVLQDAFAEYEARYTPEAYVATTPARECLQSRWHEGPVWVVLKAAQIVGTVAAVPDGDSLYIRSMAVSRSFRSCGLGNLLLQHVEHFAKANGFRRMILSTTPFLQRAIRLYEQYGFQQICGGPSELFGTSLLTMAKIVNE